MKSFILALTIFLISCNDSQPDEQKPEIIIPASIDSTRVHAENILEGRVKPIDDELTFRCMDSLQSPNPETRNFYFGVFKRIVAQSDGALSDIVIEHLNKFLLDQPKEFIAHYKKMRKHERDDMIRYLSYYYYDNDNVLEEVFNRDFNKAWRNCIDCSNQDSIVFEGLKSTVKDSVIRLRVENAG